MPKRTRKPKRPKNKSNKMTRAVQRRTRAGAGKASGTPKPQIPRKGKR